eukprot:m.105346 g.105346  ORF g.105346 m.105346 type:complete len:653 (-) comp13871_c0_seq1:167-2125(-)
MASSAEQDRIVYAYLKKHKYERAADALSKDSKVQSLDQYASNAARSLTLETGVTRIAAYDRGEQDTPEAIEESYSSLIKWIDSSLDQYKNELYNVTYPIFVHCYLDLVVREYFDEAKKFMSDHGVEHEQYHDREVQELMGIATPDHMNKSELVTAFRNSKYNLQLCSYSFDLLVTFLQEHQYMALLKIVNEHLAIKVLSGKPQQNFTAIGMTGSSPEEVDSLKRKQVLWGTINPAEVDLALEEDDDMNAEEEEDAEAKAKRKAAKKAHPMAPKPDRIPFPPIRGRPLAMKVAQLKDMRKRVELSSSQLPSTCLYTFFNAKGRIHSLAISDDASLIAASFSDSYIKIFSLDGKGLRGLKSSTELNEGDITGDSKLEEFLEAEAEQSKTLIGHSGPVYEVSFSPDNSFLVSASEDGTVRLWNLLTFTNVVCYKGHMNPVWSISFSPLGYYFATASHDRTARLWSTDHIYPLRMFAGHLSDVDVVRFHPNSNYVATGSTDRSCRLWDVLSGECMRIFEGHTLSVQILAFSDDGQYMASGSDDCTVILWEIASGKRLVTYTGHKCEIYDLAFSGDGALLSSSSADNTVKIWAVRDAIRESAGLPVAEEEMDTSEAHGGAEKASHELVTLATKETPVFCLKFSPRNLLFAAGVFSPN